MYFNISVPISLYQDQKIALKLLVNYSTLQGGVLY